MPQSSDRPKIDKQKNAGIVSTTLFWFFLLRNEEQCRGQQHDFFHSSAMVISTQYGGFNVWQQLNLKVKILKLMKTASCFLLNNDAQNEEENASFELGRTLANACKEL